MAETTGVDPLSRKLALTPPAGSGEDIAIDSQPKVNAKTWHLRQIAPAPDYVDIAFAPSWLQDAHRQRQIEHEILGAHKALMGDLVTVRPWDPDRDS